MEQIHEPTLLLSHSAIDIFKSNFVEPKLEAFLTANQILHCIYEKGTKIIYNHYLRTKLPQHYANFLSDAHEHLVIHEIRAYDPGENIDSYLINWTEEEEPVKYVKYLALIL